MIKRILVPVDFSKVTSRVLAAAIAQARPAGAEIVLIHVESPEPEFVGFEPGPKSVRQSLSKEIRADHRGLAALEAQLKKKNIPVKALLLQGPTVAKILKEARQFKVNLIVMGTRGKSPLKDLLLGSVSKGVLQKAPCPVLLVRSSV